MTKQEILDDVQNILKLIINKEVNLDISTPLLGANNLIDSLTVMELIAWCNDFYKINVLEEDISLECLKTVGSFVDRIYQLKE